MTQLTEEELAIKTTVKSLQTKKHDLYSQARKIEDAIKGIRSTCSHEKEKYDGHGHNYSVYICEVCGRERNC